MASSNQGRRFNFNAIFNRLSNIEGDFTEILTIPEIFLRGGGLFKREGCIKRGFELPGHHQAHDRGEIGQVAHGRADDGQVLGEHITVVDLELGPAGVAHRQQAAALLERAQAVHKGSADVVHHHIHALFVRRQEDGFGPVRVFGTVDQDVRAHGFRFFQLFRARPHDHDLRAAIFGDVDAGGIDPAPRADHQHRFARLAVSRA
jgi:hypothetical protein